MNTPETSLAPEARPRIRSFARRMGRLSAAQARYLEAMMPEIGVPFRAMPLDLDALFGRAAPKILEIGCGMGETTARIAAAHPENDYLGVEVYTPGVGSLCKRIAEMGISNLRVIQYDAVEVVRLIVPENALAGIHIFFPDPWPKKRHRKRRLIQPPFIAELTRRLKPGGYIHCATDWEDYAVQMLAVLTVGPDLVNTTADYAPRPDYRPLTKFERRGLKLGHGVWDLVFVRQTSSA
ncbi:MAG: tRNA (guanosine(46)-N7)-methyltransferase TrmB [Zoogloeaceae bacterium]|jgi:tRNA (guanine-N7-)-methyltransferase|nr:tRNA (guanosine(46)-N7)-methyltransferase TrmB [Zoogloeaceae bacterium]